MRTSAPRSINYLIVNDSRPQFNCNNNSKPLCSLFVELFPCLATEQRHKMAQAAYETAIHNTGERKQVKLLWTEYLHYMCRRLRDKQATAEEVSEIFHRCLVTVPAVTPLPYSSSKSWSDYRFHNEVKSSET